MRADRRNRTTAAEATFAGRENTTALAEAFRHAGDGRGSWSALAAQQRGCGRWADGTTVAGQPGIGAGGTIMLHVLGVVLVVVAGLGRWRVGPMVMFTLSLTIAC